MKTHKMLNDYDSDLNLEFSADRLCVQDSDISGFESIWKAARGGSVGFHFGEDAGRPRAGTVAV